MQYTTRRQFFHAMMLYSIHWNHNPILITQFDVNKEIILSSTAMKMAQQQLQSAVCMIRQLGSAEYQQEDQHRGISFDLIDFSMIWREIAVRDRSVFIGGWDRCKTRQDTYLFLGKLIIDKFFNLSTDRIVIFVYFLLRQDIHFFHTEN